MTRKIRYLSVLLICVLSLFSVSAIRAEYGPEEGSIRGAAFLDSNRNGVMDPGEEGVGWVYFTISNGEYSHLYHSEWQTTDKAGNSYATGYFGPAPLNKGWWKVTFHVPEGYVATTPTEQTVNVPGSEGGHIAEIYLGLYPTTGGVAGGVSVLPRTGATVNPIVLGSLALLGVGSLVALGLGLSARRKR